MNILEEVRKVDLLRVVQDLGFDIHQHRKIFCPFHEEKTPSLVLYPQTNTYYCFGCGKRGDVVHFYAAFTRQEYKLAMHELAYHYVPAYLRKGPPPPNRITARAEIPADFLPDTKVYTYQPLHTEIYEALKTYCESQPETSISQEANEYLRQRGFSDYTLRRFGIFVIKDYHSASYFLRSQFATADLRDSGLYNEKDNLIFYKHAIIIPYYQNEKLVYLQGRVIGRPEDKTPRYQFLNGVPISLFNGDMLRKVRTGRTVYLTEGAFDCMTLVQQGHPAVSLGSVTLFKKEWAKLFQRFEICFWFDNDPAGQHAVKAYRDIFEGAGLSTYSRTVKDGFKDINEYFTRRDQEE
ncbi:CHC2 zinc finger domain-containing protein [Telluribacter sp.]|jgi:DNA primase|uniref:CHC2 zinc finger domain-containing protein n=1 Tax=Telluribacter sp. TaxID=1978767 RepID=UPI002E1625C7|nr:CHC2 zinc finger domain-containing protein [Telluribacter sp.]